MKKLCANGHQTERLSLAVEDLRGMLLSLRLENDALKKEIEASKQRQKTLRADFDQTPCCSSRRQKPLPGTKLDELQSSFIQEEPDDEATAQCEDAVLKLFLEKL